MLGRGEEKLYQSDYVSTSLPAAVR